MSDTAILNTAKAMRCCTLAVYTNLQNEGKSAVCEIKKKKKVSNI